MVPWAAVAIGAFKVIRDNSFLWHIRAGELQIESGSVLTQDPFSFTRLGEPWLTQSWLADAMYAWLHDLTGLAFTPWQLLLTGLVTLGLAATLVFRVTRSVTTTAILTFLTALLLVPVMVPRPVAFSFPLLLMVVLAWENPRLRWVLPFVFWLWASIHGSFFLGLLYIFLRWLAERDWPAWRFGLASGVATLLTAHGLGTAVTVGRFLALREELERMSEWQTPDFLSPVLLPFIMGLIIIMLGGMRGNVVRTDFWVFLPFLMLALSANRGVLPAWLAILPITAKALGPIEWRKGRGFPMPVALTAALMIIAVPLPFVRAPELDAERFPLGAASHLLDRRTFHDDAAGGFFIYNSQFTEGVYVDDRVELYQAAIGEFVDVRDGRIDYEPVFARWEIEQAVVTSGGPLHRLLEADDWQEFYRDADFTVMRPD